MDWLEKLNSKNPKDWVDVAKEIQKEDDRENKSITVNAKEKNHSMVRFASLDKNIIQPLEEQWKFIKVEKIGRNSQIDNSTWIILYCIICNKPS